ncbi:MAG: restriction endonuclease [Bacteroidota bacterium]
MDDKKLQVIPLVELKELLDCDLVTIQVPLPSINVTNSYIDIIWDYLDASFVIESLSNKFLVKNLHKIWDIKHYPVYQFEIEKFNNTELSTLIKTLIWSFQSPQNQELENEYYNYRNKINEYEERITELNFKQPAVIDDYLMNLINGAYYELEYEIISDQLFSFPERNYGYFVGSKYNNLNNKVLFSINSWIVPDSISLEEVFGDHGYEEKISLLPSHLLLIDHKTVAISEVGVIEIPMGQLLQAVACHEDFSSSKDKYIQKLSLDGYFFQHSPEINDLYNKYPEIIRNPSLFKIFISEFSDFCVVSISSVQIVLFDISMMSNNESKKFLNAAMHLLSSIEDELVIESQICIDWSDFDDEIFEQLCYDIIYHSSKFDRNTIRKMGKSRSRDGGRDILVYTRSISGEKPRKYIFQCKLSKRENSINTSNVGSISDVIDQYGADGYGLICNCYIDSTLFDRLDGISNNRCIDIETWSCFEVERFLSRRPNLKQRYKIN